MNKTDYLRKKGLIPPDLGVMYIISSTRTGAKMTELPIWDVQAGGVKYKMVDGTLVRGIASKKYIFRESPFEMEIEDGKEYGEDHGYGTGQGDLWGWSHYGTFDRTLAEKLLDEENLRVIKTYQLMF